MAKAVINLQKESGGIVKISPADGTGVTELVVPESGNLVSVDTAVTDNAIARYDSTTGKLQNSGVVIDDNNNVGIGTSSPGYKVDITNASGGNMVNASYTGGVKNPYIRLGINSDTLSEVSAGNSDNTCALGLKVNGTERVRIDSAGNVGIGVTPSAWSGFKALQQQNTSISSNLNEQYITSNGYYNGSNWIYNSNTGASQYLNNQGTHIWKTAPSGTAGNTISWTDNMTLNSNGNLLVGTNIDNGVDKLQVNGTITASGSIRYNDINNIAWTASATGLDTLDFYVNSTNASSGDVMEITCVFNHYGLLNYGCVWKGIVANGTGGLTSAIIINNSSEPGGSFSITRINSRQLKITKNAGTYDGDGMLMVKVSGTHISKGN